MNELVAVCSDFYVNQKLSVKLDLPPSRESVSDMFERIRKKHPLLDQFKRTEEELSLESKENNGQYQWLALKKTTLRSGIVNPECLLDAYELHELLLDIAPYYLSIRPIDIDYLEVMYGFDLHAPINRNEVVMDALFGGTLFSKLISSQEEDLIDLQPFIGIDLGVDPRLQAFVEVKTRMSNIDISSHRWSEDPISIYLTVRRVGPVGTEEKLQDVFKTIAFYLEKLSEERVLPFVVHPIYKTIHSI